MFCWEVEKHIEDHLVTCFQNEKIGHKTAIFPVLQNLTHMWMIVCLKDEEDEDDIWASWLKLVQVKWYASPNFVEGKFYFWGGCWVYSLSLWQWWWQWWVALDLVVGVVFPVSSWHKYPHLMIPKHYLPFLHHHDDNDDDDDHDDDDGDDDDDDWNHCNF